MKASFPVRLLTWAERVVGPPTIFRLQDTEVLIFVALQSEQGADNNVELNLRAVAAAAQCNLSPMNDTKSLWWAIL